jgi:limonene 1,2-monooxygenase
LLLASKLRFGSFIVPFHAVEENPTLALRRDLELVSHLEELGFDEAWFGEHHSAGWELIASPELMIAAAAERTSRIMLGSAVNSLPYHHPLILAERYSQLDHMTRGRAILGMGPGALASDAKMMGIEVARQRDMMDEAIDVMVRLMRGETVSAKTDWFTLDNARIHMSPYSRPSIEMTVGSVVSPTGARAAGRHGLSMLSFGATTSAGFGALASNWAIAEDIAAEHGQTMDRSRWRLVAPMHISDSREKALEEVKYNIDAWAYYIREVVTGPIAPGSGDIIETLLSSNMAVIGTPDDAVKQIRRLQEQTGGFGALLLFHTNWADVAQTRRSYELFARFVMPQIDDRIDNRAISYEECRLARPDMIGKIGNAVQDRIRRHIAEKGTANIPPSLVAALTDKPEA